MPKRSAASEELVKVRTRSGKALELHVPSDAEEAAIQAGIAADQDASPTDEAWFKKTRLGRPPSLTPKVFTGIRLDADVLDAFKAEGAGWQTRINAALRDWLKAHR